MQAPAWLDELLRSSEAMAVLSLAGNHAATLRPDAVGHTVVHYASRGLAGERLGPAFAYDVLAVFGEGSSGRAVAFRPHHAASSVCIAFRGVRVEQLGPERQPKAPRHPPAAVGLASGAAPAARNAAAGAQCDDLAALLDLMDSPTAWPHSEARYRVHHGILTHHEAIWAAGSKGEPAESLGMHHQAVWSRATGPEPAVSARRHQEDVWAAGGSEAESGGHDGWERCGVRGGEWRGEPSEPSLSSGDGMGGAGGAEAPAGRASLSSAPASQLPGYGMPGRALPSTERQPSSEPSCASPRPAPGPAPKRKLPFVVELPSPSVSSLVVELPSPSASSLPAEVQHFPSPESPSLCSLFRKAPPSPQLRGQSLSSLHSTPHLHIDLDQRSSTGDSACSHQQSSAGDSCSHQRSSIDDLACSHQRSSIDDSACSHQRSSIDDSACSHRRSSGGDSCSHQRSSIDDSACSHQRSLIDDSACSHQRSSAGDSCSHQRSSIDDSACSHQRSSAGDSCSHQRSSIDDSACSHRRSSGGDSACSRDSVCSQQPTSRRQDARSVWRFPVAIERIACEGGVSRGEGGGGDAGVGGRCDVREGDGRAAGGGSAVEGLGEVEGQCAVDGLGEWLCRCGGSLDRILFVGLSLGASLAQLSALRVASEPHLAALLPRLYVLAMGAARWADAFAADRFRLSLGSRAVHLINSMAVPPPLPRSAFWWMAEEVLFGWHGRGEGEPTPCDCMPHHATHSTQHDAHDSRAQVTSAGARAGECGGGPGCGARVGGGFVMVDPLTAAFSPSHSLLHNVVFCHQIHAPGHTEPPPAHGPLATPGSLIAPAPAAARQPLAAPGPLAACAHDYSPHCHPPGGAGACTAGGEGGGIQIHRQGAGQISYGAVRARERAFGTESIVLGKAQFAAVAAMCAQPGALAALMQGRLPLRHPMADAYLALHLGRRYRAAFLGLYLARCAAAEGVDGVSTGGVNGALASSEPGSAVAIAVPTCPAPAAQSPSAEVAPPAPPPRAPLAHVALGAPLAMPPVRLRHHSPFPPPPGTGSPFPPPPAGSLKRSAPDQADACQDEAQPDTPHYGPPSGLQPQSGLQNGPPWGNTDGTCDTPAGAPGTTHSPTDDRRHILTRARSGRPAGGKGGMARTASSCASLCELTSLVEVASYNSVSELAMV